MVRFTTLLKEQALARNQLRVAVFIIFTTHSSSPLFFPPPLCVSMSLIKSGNSSVESSFSSPFQSLINSRWKYETKTIFFKDFLKNFDKVQTGGGVVTVKSGQPVMVSIATPGQPNLTFLAVISPNKPDESTSSWSQTIILRCSIICYTLTNQTKLWYL